jgi:large subunit ribosomal protein L24
MKIKKGDSVRVITGKDAGKTAKVLKVMEEKNRATVEGVNLLVKHMRPRKSGEKGQRIQFPSPIQVSNLMLVCPSCSQPTRVGYEVREGKKSRQCKKCKNVFQ